MLQRSPISGRLAIVYVKELGSGTIKSMILAINSSCSISVDMVWPRIESRINIAAPVGTAFVNSVKTGNGTFA